jgi:hypothetical protein
LSISPSNSKISCDVLHRRTPMTTKTNSSTHSISPPYSKPWKSAYLQFSVMVVYSSICWNLNTSSPCELSIGHSFDFVCVQLQPHKKIGTHSSWQLIAISIIRRSSEDHQNLFVGGCTPYPTSSAVMMMMLCDSSLKTQK